MADPYALLASLFNASGIAVAVLLSLYVQRRFPRTWFKYWTWGYAAGLVSLSLETAALSAGRTPAMSVVELVAVALNIVLQWQTIQAIRGRALPPRIAGGLTAALVTAGLGALLAGVPLLTILAGPMLMFSLNFMALGVVMLRSPAPARVQRWLGGPLIALGLVPFMYPLIFGTPYLWVGYYAGGLLNLLVGVGMVVAAMELSAIELESANERLKQHDRLKTQIFNNVSHEIRTPLTAIRAAAVAMAQGAPAGEEFAALISDQVVRLDHMLSDILDVAQLESGTLTYAVDDCDLAELAETSGRMFQPLYAEAGLTLQLALPDDLLDVQCDRDRIMQVLANLLENARKFTPAGGTVTLSAAATPTGARIAVADDGPGVPDALRETIFEKFFQVDGGPARKVGGAGLGLAICRAIVEDGHGGRIWVEPGARGGATFVVELARTPRPTPPRGLTAPLARAA